MAGECGRQLDAVMDDISDDSRPICRGPGRKPVHAQKGAEQQAHGDRLPWNSATGWPTPYDTNPRQAQPPTRRCGTCDAVGPSTSCQLREAPRPGHPRQGPRPPVLTTSDYLNGCLRKLLLPQVSDVLRSLFPKAADRGLIPRSRMEVPFWPRRVWKPGKGYFAQTLADAAGAARARLGCR